MEKHVTLNQSLFQLSWEGGAPFYATALSAGFDIYSSQSITLEPGKRVLVPTGLRILWNHPPFEVKVGEATGVVLVPELQLRPRSGLALRHGLTVLNSPSTIDADYRGEIQLIMINHGQETCHIKSGERVAQAVCALIIQLPQLARLEVARGACGFGSTGV